jgi:hypothetical protein
MRRTLTASTIALMVLVAVGQDVHAQSRFSDRTAIEAVAAISTDSTDFTDPMLVFDAVATVRVGAGFDVIVRPYSRRLPGGDWSAEFYQLQVQYQSATRVPIRVDAGVITSPLGLGTLEMRPDRNPVIGSPFYYYSPLPRFDARPERMNLLAPGYPIGVVVSASSTRWDVRGGVTDGTPARMRHGLSPDRPAATPNLVAGGGVTPMPGLRLGTAVAHGRYRPSSGTVSLPGDEAAATVFNVEGEYAVGFTRVTGEWIVDRFETASDPAISRGYTVLAVRTLSPRVFVAGRTSRVSTPVYTPAGRVRRSAVGADATLGYRVTPEVTLRAGYQGVRGYGVPDWEHAVATSIVWSKRWW